MTLSPLTRSVLRQLGGGTEARERAKDAARYGAAGGFPGFIYYKETVAFFKRHKSKILAALREDADSMGEDWAKMLAGFRCFKGLDPACALAVGPLHEDYETVANGLAWYALERAGMELENE
jgi:hypothetical protein